MTIAAILIAVLLAFLAFRFVTGMIKFGVIAILLVVVIYFVVKAGGLG
jgi:hypothetical protein